MGCAESKQRQPSQPLTPTRRASQLTGPPETSILAKKTSAGTLKYRPPPHVPEKPKGPLAASPFVDIAMGAVPPPALPRGPSVPSLRFFDGVKVHLCRNYVLLIDQSTSMVGSRWEETHRAVSRIAQHVCEFDPDGVDIVFFSSKSETFRHVNTPEQVHKLFDGRVPKGSTNLAGALREAFRLHFEGAREFGTTILCITDGEPDSRDEVVREIRLAANRISEDPELSVSFIQVGDDEAATKYLKMLDDDMHVGHGARFDIVDTLTADRVHNITFDELIQLSVTD